MPAEIRIGDKLDSKYRILRRLGHGAFGDVYLGEDELLGRQVAIKVLKDRDPKQQADLVDEMQVLNHLSHSGVVAFYHHFLKDDLLFLVMEYCGRGSLRDWLRERRTPVHEVMQWGKNLADILYFVHQRNIVHHDIKPDNILLTAEGTLKIGDFGIANSYGGTMAYLAPEMHFGGVATDDARVDVYALGITLLELLIHGNPFRGMSPLDALRVKLLHDFIPQELDGWVQEIISKATHPTPELRFQTMREFQEAIEAKHVSYIFDRNRIKADALAAKAEEHLAKKQTIKASKCIHQALHFCADSVSALIAAGRFHLFLNRIPEAKAYFDRALAINPRTNIQKELGWLSLEAGKYSPAISLLTDHLQRHAADYEAYNLLLECFYRTDRYEACIELVGLMVAEKAPSDCFVNNLLLCTRPLGSIDNDLLDLAQKKKDNPFIRYNIDRFKENLDPLRPLLLFENYRFGLPTQRDNTITIEYEGRLWEMKEPVISLGRNGENGPDLRHKNVSPRHCAIVNYYADVWIYDLGSPQGLFVDGKQIDGKAHLDGVHAIGLGNCQLTLSSKLGLLL